MISFIRASVGGCGPTPREQVPENPVSQLEPTVLDELEHCRGRDGLGEARDTEERVRLNRDLMQPVRHSEAAGVDEAPVAHDRDRSAWNTMLTHDLCNKTVVRLQPQDECPRLDDVRLGR